MADNKLELLVQVNAETGQLEIVQKGLVQTAAASKKTEEGFLNLSKEAKELLSALGLIATTTSIIKFFKDSVNEAEEESEALRRLSFNLESNGVSWEANKGKIQSWGESLQKTTRFSDTEAFSSLEKMVRITGNLAQAQSSVALAMDLSVASGKSLEESLDLLTNLINGNSRALIQTKKEFGDVVAGAKDNDEVIARLTQKYQGLAEAEKSLTKEQASLKNQINDLQEDIGKTFTPAISFLIERIKDLITGVRLAGDAIAGLAVKLYGAFTHQQDIVKASSQVMWDELVKTAEKTTKKEEEESFKRVAIHAREGDEIVNKRKEMNDKLAEQMATSGPDEFSNSVAKLEDEIQKYEAMFKRKEDARIRITEDGVQRAITMEQYRVSQMNHIIDEESVRIMAREKQKQDDLIKIQKEADKERLKMLSDNEVAFIKSQERIKVVAETVAAEFSSSFTKSLSDVAFYGKSFELDIVGMLERIIERLVEMQIQMAIIYGITGNAPMGFLFGAPSAGGGPSGAPGPMGSPAASSEMVFKALADQLNRETPEGRKMSMKINEIATKNAARGV